MTSEFPAQRAINAENVSIWWRHQDICSCIINGPLFACSGVARDYKRMAGCWAAMWLVECTALKPEVLHVQTHYNELYCVSCIQTNFSRYMIDTLCPYVWAFICFMFKRLLMTSSISPSWFHTSQAFLNYSSVLCLVPYINHLFPICCSTSSKSVLKRQWACKFGITADNVFRYF